ncbi:laminin-like protein epi-1 [Nematostella vectensis]|nr:laminin-like protein epi-1 [Nematostella vectensis]
MAAVAALVASFALILQQISTNLANPSQGTANVAFMKQAEAQITCGLRAREKYFAVSQMSQSPRNRVESTCDAYDPELSHNASNLVDNNESTWWQSTASVGTANITIRLTGPAFKQFYVDTIQIKFGEYYRPRQMALKKSINNGQSFDDWHYFVSYPDPDKQCKEKFDETLQTQPSKENDVLCTGYPDVNSQSIGQVVEWKPHFLRGQLENPSQKLLEWINVTDIRLEFITMERVFDVLAAKWHHYAVSEVRVFGFCACNGQGTGCKFNSTVGDFQCVCQPGSCGYYCDECCPAYNQYPWKKGGKGPLIVDTAAACQPCNCHDHSFVCVYNETVARMNASLDMSRQYSGGGVCQDCKHNTEGINCERCRPLYYRPENRSQNAVDACESCNCSEAGSRDHALPGVLHLDCLRDVNVSETMKPGDCFCKNNTMGRRCHLCKPGFFNLTSNNPLGCQVCDCDTAGARNSSNICEGDAHGQCPCKQNVQGLRCDTCNNTYYGLSRQDTHGCRPCLCDYGGSSSPVCNKTDGQCKCLPNIDGRQCDRPLDEYYFPDLHFIGADFSHQKSEVGQSSVSWVTSFTVVDRTNKTSGSFSLVISYQSATRQEVTGSVTSPEGTTTQQVTLPPCNQTCHQNLSVFGEMSLTGKVTVNVTAANDDFRGVRASVVPREFYEASALGDRRDAFIGNCSVTTNSVRVGEDAEDLCKAGVFTLTTDYLGQALACECNRVGSVNLTCQKYAGQCHCKPGVTGRKCDQCQQGFYNLTTTGCSACNCAADDKVCDHVTGQCKCPTNTEGRMCDRCNATYWGWNSTTGCQACRCDSMGSMDLQCNLTTGICSCKPGVTRTKCTECADGYKNFSSAGCAACDCDVNGSRSGVCNKTSGQCPCKNNTVNLLCDRCDADSFYLTKSNPIGCLDCICSGITTNCRSTTQFVYQRSVGLDLWTLGEEDSVAGLQVLQYRMPGSGMEMLRGNVSTSQTLYWKAHSNFTQTSLVGAYGGNLSFTLHMSNQSGNTIGPNVKIIMKGLHNVTIEAAVASIPVAVPTTRSVFMREISWLYRGSSEPVSRAHFMLVLATPRAILVTASLYTSGGQDYFSSFGGAKVSATRPSPPVGDRALEVEQCTCGPEYSGLSCERCAPGHHRVNVSGDPFYGKCIPCNCNNHTNDCYADTGLCYNCKHNTAGEHCELCDDGFYGNAADGTPGDCKQCPCDAPRTTTSMCMEDAGRPVCHNCSEGYEGDICGRCESRYFGKPLDPGGNCSLCQCNNNTEICNTTTGQCTNCQYNTTGFHCERCQNETYGDAKKQQCVDCLCDSTGSYNNVCDYKTGQCECKPNVGLRNCSKCEEFSYNFTSAGCTECKCNKFGSIHQQCNESGTCKCKNNTTGEKCEWCEWGFFGLPKKECQPCACNKTGSYNSSTCDRETGQCKCKPGVAGQNCDRCSVQHVNFTDTGCIACDICTRLGLQGIINSTQDTLQGADNKGREVEKLKLLKPELEKLNTKIENTQALIEKFDKRIQTIRSGLELMKSNTLNNSVRDLERQISSLTTEAKSLQTNTSQEMNRILPIYNNTLREQNLIDTVSSQVTRISTQLADLKTSANTMLASYSFVTRNFAPELTRVDQELSSANEASTRAQQGNNDTLSQQKTMKALNTSITRNQNEFHGRQTEIQDNAKHADDVTKITESVRLVVNDAQSLIDQGKSIIAHAQRVLDNTTSILSNTWTQISQGQQSYKETTEILKGSIGLQQLSTNLTSSFAPTQVLLGRANRTVAVNGTKHAADLTGEARLRTTEFESVSDHGRLAVQAIKQYENVVETVSKSVNTSIKVNASLHVIMNSLKNFTLTFSAMESQAQRTYNLSKALLDKTKARNIDIAGLQTNLTSSNQTYVVATRVGQSVATYHEVLLARSSLLLEASEPGREHSVVTASKSVWTYKGFVEKISSPLMTDAKACQAEVSRLDASMAYINHSAQHSQQLMQKAFANVQNASAMLPNVVSAVRSAEGQRNITSSLQQQLQGNMTRVQEKLRLVKEKVAKIRHALSLKGNTSVEYTPVGGQVQDSPFNDIALDFRADSSMGPLLYYADGVANSAKSLALTLVYNQYVQFTFDLGPGPITITNWEVTVRQGNWYRVYASRYNKNGRLSVTDYSMNYSRTYESNTNQIVPNTNINFTSASPLYIGGLPEGVMPNQTQRFFRGCIDNVVVNQKPLSLWKPKQVNGNRYACSKCITSASTPLFYDVTSGTSLFGSPDTYIKQNMGTFDISRDSEINLEFRTFLPISSMFNVLGTEGYIYGVYLNMSGVTFYFKSGAQSYALSTNKTSYSDGRWYNLRLTRGLANATLTVTPVNSQGVIDSVSINLPSPLLMPTGRYLIFGGKEPQSPFLAPLNVHFAGSIRHLNVSSSAGGVVPRSLDDKALTQAWGQVDFCGVLSSVEEAIRFRGDGYAGLSSGITDMNSLSLKFKTLQPSGLLVYSGDVSTGYYFFLALFHGNLFLASTKTPSAYTPLTTAQQTLNDGAYHTVVITFTAAGLRLDLDEGRWTRSVDLSTVAAGPARLNGTLYVGGVRPGAVLPLQVPVVLPFVGDMKYININGISQNIFSGHSKQVSLAGGSPERSVVPTPLPTIPPPTQPPPTCGDRYPRLTRSKEPDEINLGPGNYVAFSPSERVLRLIKSQGVVTLEFRSMSPNGVMLYGADNVSHPNEFISVELVNGKIVFKYDTGAGLVRVESNFNYYSAGGVWYKVHLLRINQFGVILVPDTKDYKNARQGDSRELLTINTPIYMGGVPPGVNTSMLESGGVSFIGCMKTMSIQSSNETETLNPRTERDISLSSVTNQTCYSTIQAQASFNGEGQILLYNDFTLPSTFDMSLKFRTVKRSGLLLVITNHTGKGAVTLEQLEGQIVLSFTSESEPTVMRWTDPAIPPEREYNASYQLCDNQFHEIRLQRAERNITLSVDKHSPLTYALPDLFLLTGKFYIGGVPDNSGADSHIGFSKVRLDGCVESLRIDTKLVELLRAPAVLGQGVTQGCRAPV